MCFGCGGGGWGGGEGAEVPYLELWFRNDLEIITTVKFYFTFLIAPAKDEI